MSTSASSAPICLIVNPAAGGGKAGRVAAAAEQTLRDYGQAVRRVDTRDLNHARALALQAAHAGELVVALSGDGMIGVIADELRTVPGAVLGVLPGGRGNDLARVLGVGNDPRAACATIAHGRPRAMDVGEVIADAAAAIVTAAGAATAARSTHGQAFVGIASAGFDSDANRIANEAPPWLGGLVYAYGLLRALVSWRPAHFEIELDGGAEHHSFTGYSVAVANSRAYGGGMYMAPDALLDDGMLDIIAIEAVGKLRYLANAPKVFKGTHVRMPTVRAFRAAEVRISADRQFTMYADGDPISELPVRVRGMRGAVNVLVPADSKAGSAFASPLPPGPPSAVPRTVAEASRANDEAEGKGNSAN